MKHDCNDKAEEGDDVLDHEELVREISDRRNGTDVHPYQDCVYSPSGGDAGVGCVFEGSKRVSIP